jgi:hypothetical protein
MTGCTDVLPVLSDFVDDGLSFEVKATVDAHLKTCAACRELAEDLRAISQSSRTLEPISPPDRVWAGISARLNEGSRRPRIHVVTSRWIGLAAAVLLVAATGYFGLRAHKSSAGAPEGNAPAVASVKTVEQELAEAERHYERAIAELEAISQRRDDVLDPAIARTLRESLQTIDAAIQESRKALSAEPDNDLARASLFDALHSKLGVLQTAVSVESRTPDVSEGTRRSGGDPRKKS